MLLPTINSLSKILLLPSLWHMCERRRGRVFNRSSDHLISARLSAAPRLLHIVFVRPLSSLRTVLYSEFVYPSIIRSSLGLCCPDQYLAMPHNTCTVSGCIEISHLCEERKRKIRWLLKGYAFTNELFNKCWRWR